MLGYMTEKEALEHGFTHHGSYYGIPVWIAPRAGFMVATKWAPLEIVMSAAHIFEGFLQAMFFPHEEPTFRFVLGQEIRRQ